MPFRNIPASHYVWEASDNCHRWPVRVTSGHTLDEAIIALRESYDFAGETDPAKSSCGTRTCRAWRTAKTHVMILTTSTTSSSATIRTTRAATA